MNTYKISYYYKENNEWKYHQDIVKANKPEEIVFPNMLLWNVTAELLMYQYYCKRYITDLRR